MAQIDSMDDRSLAGWRSIGRIAVTLLAAAPACDDGGMDDGAACPTDPTASACTDDPDQVAGNLIMLSDNGGWSWFQDERVIHDPEGGNLVFSSVASYLGHGGESRDADIDATTFELATGRRTRVTLGNLPRLGAGDDHNPAALWQRTDGRYLAMYTGHLWGFYGDQLAQSFYRIATEPNDGTSWEPERIFTWPENDTTAPIRNDVTYSNLLWLAGEGRLYNIARAAGRTPSIMVSGNEGETWSYAGKLSMVDENAQRDQFANGYFKFSSNGSDRFDFIATDHHPHDFNTSIYHGYVRGGRTYDGRGALVDDTIFDEVAPAPAEFVPVWQASPTSEGSYHHAWPVDLERDGGRLYALFTTRYGMSISNGQPGDADHRLFYARFDGSRWHVHEVTRMGGPLYFDQYDYTGLGAIHPNDPRTIYVSTPLDPRDGTRTEMHEIYRGVTEDGGESWAWTPITVDSTVDNLRPIIPSWDADHTAVLWLRGDYQTMRRYDLSVVGVIDRSCSEATGRITYVDADESNTTEADGSALRLTAGSSRGATDDRWHRREGFGNSDDVLASNERGDEDAPRLRTRIAGLRAGTYDVFVFHWADPDEDWRIQAGLSTPQMLLFRHKAAQVALPGHFVDGADVVRTGEGVAMYRSYVGRTTVTATGRIEVLVDDVGGGLLERTWYDGLGYARVSPTGCR